MTRQPPPFKFSVRFINLNPFDPQWAEASFEVDATTREEAEAKAREQWERDHPGWSTQRHSVEVSPQL